MTTPTVSVVMAAYNGAALIGATLESLAAQSFGDFEAIVVDDRSTDATRDLVAAWPDPRVRLVVKAENEGPVRTRNRAVAEARGRYIAALDQDDICLPGRFARQVAYLDAHPEIALLGTQTDFLCDGVVGRSHYPAVTTPSLVRFLAGIENPLAWSTVMLRTDAARALDPFTRPELLYAEDFDLYHRIQPHGGIARLDETLLHYRQHAGGASKRFTERMNASATRVLAEAHGSLFGDEAEAIAQLIVLHNMSGVPVSDRATLARLGRALGAIQRDFLARHPVSAEDRKLIRWESAQRWGRIGRAALRSGSLSLADILSVRPEHLGLGYAGLDTLLWSGAIGGARRMAAAGR